MKLFTTLFNLTKLPIIVVKDTITLLPDLTTQHEPFSDTKRLCEEMDEDLEG